ncbi:MAG: glycosyltransferase family 4 protein, partial [Phycisphaeraceae bacterium]|nr:glycosyltransferase family 4 protein [Phycisphaeraceae bacterium]
AEARSLAGIDLRVAGGLDTKNALGLIGFTEWVEKELSKGPFDVTLSVSSSVPADVIQPRSGTVKEALDRRVAIRKSFYGRWMKRFEIWASMKRQTLLAAEKKILQSESVRRIVPISQYVADQLHRHYRIPPRRIRTIFNCAQIVPLDEQMRAIYRRQIRSELQIDQEAVVFLFAALDPKLKGLDILLQAMKKLADERDDVCLMIAGTTSAWHRKLSQRLGLEDRVRWLGSVQEMERYYAAASVTVLPTWFDSSSRVVLESLMHSVPAISTLFDGSAQWIYRPDGSETIPGPYQRDLGDLVYNDRSAGRVLRCPENVGALKRAMEQLCDPAVRKACASHAAGLWDQVDFDRHLDQLEEVLFEAADKKPPERGRRSPDEAQSEVTSIARSPS